MKLLLWLLKQKRLKQTTKIEIVNYLLASVNALPIKDLISFEPDGTLKIGNKILDSQQAIMLRESLVSLNKNWADRVLSEQITYEAIKIGVHIGQTTDQIMFAKAAIWVLKQREELITKLIGQTGEKDDIIN